MNNGTADGIILGIIDRFGYDGGLIRGRESPEALTCLALATFYDMTDETETDYDDDYSKELHLDRKAREGWTHCEDCGDSIHLDDLREGASCSCDDDGKAHPMNEHMRVLGEILANKARKSDE